MRRIKMEVDTNFIVPLQVGGGGQNFLYFCPTKRQIVCKEVSHNHSKPMKQKCLRTCSNEPVRTIGFLM